MFTNEKEISGIYKDSGVHPAIFGKLSGIKFWINLEMILSRYGFTVNTIHLILTKRNSKI